MANANVLHALDQSTHIKQVKQLSLDRAVAPLVFNSNPYLQAKIPAPAREFFASVSSPNEIMSSNLVSRFQTLDVIEGGYNFVHFLSLDTGECDEPLPFVLRFPINPDTISRSQTRTCVGCMLYCQRHPELNIPTPNVYAYSCTYGSEFIAMEYIEGDSLSDVWLGLPEGEKENMANQVAEIMRSMRTKTSFDVIGGIGPDGSACPLVDAVVVASGRVVVDSLGLYNTGPYNSVQEYVQSAFNRLFHYMDQMLHKHSLLAHEPEFREVMSESLFNLTPEGAFERIKSKRDDFMAHPYYCEYPFVLRHGDLHGRNVIVSHSSPRRILALIDWDFGGAHALPFADQGFEACWPDSDATFDVRVKQAEEMGRVQLLVDQLAGALPFDAKLTKLVASTFLDVLDREAERCLR